MSVVYAEVANAGVVKTNFRGPLTDVDVGYNRHIYKGSCIKNETREREHAVFHGLKLGYNLQGFSRQIKFSIRSPHSCISGVKLYQRIWHNSAMSYVTCSDCNSLRLKPNYRSNKKYREKYQGRPVISLQPCRFLGLSKNPLLDKNEDSLAQRPEAKTNTGKVDTIVKVQPTTKAKKERKKVDFEKAFHDNIFITPLRAIDEYLLDEKDLETFQTTKRRSPYKELADIKVILRKDVEARAIEKYGSLEKMLAEKKKLAAKESSRPFFGSPWAKKHNRPVVYMIDKQSKESESIFSHGPGRVILIAIAVNGANCVLKLGGWFHTGSHSMFSEFLHSLADTANQVILAFGIQTSLKKPDLEHPYGWSNFRNVASLISGVGIFSVGAGLSFYHGIQGLLHPTEIESLYWALSLLLGSFISEGGTLWIAILQIMKASREKNMTFFDYVWRGEDPSTNVVLLEDLAAILGVSIAGTCMSLSYFLNTSLPDAIGSLLIAGLLGVTASFIIYTNSSSLVGRSIPSHKKESMMKTLESDRVIRATHDVKATDMGGNFIRFKAEVDFDGKEITLFYLQKQDLDLMLKDVQGFETAEDLEAFLLRHGEKIVDEVGSQVDRIERGLMKRYPEIKHVDLEQL